MTTRAPVRSARYSVWPLNVASLITLFCTGAVTMRRRPSGAGDCTIEGCEHIARVGHVEPTRVRWCGEGDVLDVHVVGNVP